MKTQVIMKRDLFGHSISQQSKTELFSATELLRAGNDWRRLNGLSQFNLPQFINGDSCKLFTSELEKKYGTVITVTRGRNGQTWVHPLLFIDIALAINPRLKVEVYEWIFDNLLKFRNDSGDSYKEMSAAIFTRIGNVREFTGFIQSVAIDIKKALNIEDWQNASEDQLQKRDKIHDSIKLLCKVLTDPHQAVRIGIAEITGNN